jgi:hypothetical protein
MPRRQMNEAQDDAFASLTAAIGYLSPLLPGICAFRH